jgi:hypothetical protein
MITGRPRIHLISFATEDYSNSAKALGIKAIANGFSSFYLYSLQDLDADFVENNSLTLANERGAGYWVWKPYIILKHLSQIPQGDYLLYLDAGVMPKCQVREFIDYLQDGKIHVWNIHGVTIGEWTDPGVLRALKVSESLLGSTMVMGGAILGVNKLEFRSILERWLELCTNPKYLHPDSGPSYVKPEGLFWHRHDQSLLSVLVATDSQHFTVHGASARSPESAFFNVHRKKDLKHMSFVFTFPGLRKFRRSITNLLPIKLKTKIRFYVFEKRNRGVSLAEEIAIKQSLRKL